jgi:hypothetical protein
MIPFRYTVVAMMLAATFTGCADGGKMAAIVISPETSVIAEGTTQQFEATAFFSDGTAMAWTTAVAWTITPDEDAAGTATIGTAFGSYGLVTSSSGTGDFTVTATDAANGLRATARVHVRRPDIAITPAKAYMPFNNGVNLNYSHQFTATGTMFISENTGTTIVDLTSSVTWTTVPPSDSAAASVAPGGLVTTSTTTTGPVIVNVEYIVSGTVVSTATTTLTVTEEELKQGSLSISSSGLTVAPTEALFLRQRAHTRTGHGISPVPSTGSPRIRALPESSTAS